MNSKSIYYVAFRLINTVLGVLWGFVLMAVMVRAIGLEQYAYYVLIGAVGIYIASADLGISNVLYARLRYGYLGDGIVSLIAPARGAIVIYIVVSATAALCYAGYLLVGAPTEVGSSAGLFLFFVATLANVPWIVVRSAVAAIDRHLEFEIVDFGRRVGQFLCVVLLLWIERPAAIFLLLDVIWLVAYTLAFHSMRAGGLTGFSLAPTRLLADFRAFVASFGEMILHSSMFALSEAFSYNYPYFLLSVIWGPGAEVVLFDVFHKFLRAAIVTNQAFSMGLLPQTTRHHFAGQRAALLWTLLTVVGLSLLGIMAMNAVLFFGHDRLFGVLLHERAGLVSAAMFAAIALVSFANAVQNTAGSYIVSIGKMHLAKTLALTLAGCFAFATAVVLAAGGSFDAFLLVYAVVYVGGAIAWSWKALAVAVDETDLPQKIPGW